MDLERAEGLISKEVPGLRRRQSSCSPKTSLILSALNPATRATSWLKVAKSQKKMFYYSNVHEIN